jgi:hypothetical protein
LPIASTHTFFGRYPEISREAVELAGGFYVQWPKNAPDPNRVIAFRVVDKSMGHMGYVLQSIRASGIVKWRGTPEPFPTGRSFP